MHIFDAPTKTSHETIFLYAIHAYVQRAIDLDTLAVLIP